MKSVRVVLMVFSFLLGSMTPFVVYLVVIEMFYLLMPLGLFFFASLALIAASIFAKTLRSSQIFFIWWVIPIFVISQFMSVYAVDKIQRYRSELIIDEIESTMASTGNFPTAYDTSVGIELEYFDNAKTFNISYSRGFMVREVYQSELKSWKSYGWND